MLLAHWRGGEWCIPFPFAHLQIYDIWSGQLRLVNLCICSQFLSLCTWSRLVCMVIHNVHVHVVAYLHRVHGFVRIDLLCDTVDCWDTVHIAFPPPSHQLCPPPAGHILPWEFTPSCTHHEVSVQSILRCVIGWWVGSLMSQHLTLSISGRSPAAGVQVVCVEISCHLPYWMRP